MLTILYDGDCGFCQASKERLQSLDTTHQLNFRNSHDPAVREDYPTLDAAKLNGRMQAITDHGHVLAGAYVFEEVGRIISTQSLGGFLLRIYSHVVKLPGMLPLAQAVYDVIAKNRHRWPLNRIRPSQGVCTIQDQ